MATAYIDHIIPLAFGGSDDDANTQGLCALCHAIKTSMESASGKAAANHPDWLSQSNIPLRIVCGPPCSGKTSLVARLRSHKDMVIDLDEIADRILPGRAYNQWTGELLNQSIRVRNAMLGSLARSNIDGVAWFIVGAPTQAEREWWSAKLGGALCELDVAKEVCLERAATIGRSRAPIDDYFAASRQPWKAKKDRLPRSAIDADGYPIG